MKAYKKADFPVAKIRRFLEPGPIVLVSSAWRGKTNIPTVDLASVVVGIGNSTGAEVDKFAKFKLTAVRGAKVDAPLIEQCYANFECKVIDASLVRTYHFFVLEVVKAHDILVPVERVELPTFALRMRCSTN